jgi:hypothetical protein
MVARANFTVKPATFQWRTVTERKDMHGVRFCVASTATKFARLLLNAVSSWHIACPSESGFEINFGGKSVRYKILTGMCLLGLAAFVPGCGTTDNANTNVTATATPSTSTRPGPDNSEITTTTDANGVTTETRVFKNNPRVSRVVVTTRNGQRTARVYSATGQETDWKGDVASALSDTGDAIANGAGWVADKTVEGAKATGAAAKTVGEKTVEGAKTVGEKTAEGAKTVGSKTASGAKTVGAKTVSGTKKVGSAIKKAVTP